MGREIPASEIPGCDREVCCTAIGPRAGARIADCRPASVDTSSGRRRPCPIPEAASAQPPFSPRPIVTMTGDWDPTMSTTSGHRAGNHLVGVVDGPVAGPRSRSTIQASRHGIAITACASSRELPSVTRSGPSNHPTRSVAGPMTLTLSTSSGPSRQSWSRSVGVRMAAGHCGFLDRTGTTSSRRVSTDAGGRSAISGAGVEVNRVQPYLADPHPGNLGCRDFATHRRLRTWSARWLIPKRRGPGRVDVR